MGMPFLQLQTWRRDPAVAGHACITLASDEETSEDKSLSLSRQLVHAMLETSVSHSSRIFYEEGVRDRSLRSTDVGKGDCGKPHGVL